MVIALNGNISKIYFIWAHGDNVDVLFHFKSDTEFIYSKNTFQLTCDQ